MPYPIEVKIAPKSSWFTPAEAKLYYGRYAREGVTIHWWGGGEAANQHDNIVNYFMAQGQQGVKSVNFVVSDIKITKMVEPDDVAWASQSGNPTTVSIEFQPTLSDEGYKRGGWLIAQLEAQYGRSLSLYPHSHWFATSCPGTIDIARLRREADNFKGGNMSQSTLTTARINAYGIGGRNGILVNKDGTVTVNNANNALGGGGDADLNKSHVDVEANAETVGWYNSDEGKDWRFNRLPALVSLAAQNAPLKAENTLLHQQVADLQAKLGSMSSDPDSIIITKKGWTAVWEALKSFFNKNN